MGLYTRRNFVTVKEIGEQYSISQQMVYKLAKDPVYKGAFCKIKGSIRIDPVEFEKIVELESLNE